MEVEKKKIKEFKYFVAIKEEEDVESKLTPRRILLKEEKYMSLGEARDMAYKDWNENHCERKDGYLIVKEPTMIIEFDLKRIIKIEVQVVIGDGEGEA